MTFEIQDQFLLLDFTVTKLLHQIAVKFLSA